MFNGPHHVTHLREFCVLGIVFAVVPTLVSDLRRVAQAHSLLTDSNMSPFIRPDMASDARNAAGRTPRNRAAAPKPPPSSLSARRPPFWPGVTLRAQAQRPACHCTESSHCSCGAGCRPFRRSWQRRLHQHCIFRLGRSRRDPGRNAGRPGACCRGPDAGHRCCTPRRWASGSAVYQWGTDAPRELELLTAFSRFRRIIGPPTRHRLLPGRRPANSRRRP